MNVKLWAIVLALIVVLSGTGMYLSSNTTDDDKVVITARVNEEGSGIFAHSDNLVYRDQSGNLIKDENGLISYNSDEWVGKLFVHPGPSTIQYMMLKDIVENDLGFEFVERGATPSTQKYVFHAVLPPAQMKDAFKDGQPFAIEGGIIWESFFSNIYDDHSTGAKLVFLTGERSPEHTCCVVVANRTFANDTPTYLIRFLAAYMETVTAMNDAITAGGQNENYLKLLDAAHAYTSVDKDILKEAIAKTKFLYEMDHLVDDVVELVEGFGAMDRVLNYTPEQLGFKDSTDFAKWLVDDYYLTRAVNFKPEDATTDITLKVAILTGDLHGIALQFGLNLGIFAKYRINIEQSVVANGPAAMDLLLSGTVNIGMLGAPPTVIKSINMYK